MRKKGKTGKKSNKVKGKIDRRIDRWIDRWMDGLMDGLMDGPALTIAVFQILEMVFSLRKFLEMFI